MASEAKFSVGQVIHHKRFDYRGVVVDVDPTFQGTEAWYEEVARSRPPKDKPWYHVLVHAAGVETYVAERHLEADATGEPVDHPAISQFFTGMKDGVYQRNRATN